MNYNKATDLARATIGSEPTPYTASTISLGLIDRLLGVLRVYVDTATATLGRLICTVGIAVTGNATVTGNLAVTGNLSLVGDLAPQIQVISGDAAITIKSGTVLITKGSAAAITLAAPTAGLPSAGGDDGKQLFIETTTAFAHTVTQTTPGFNNGSTASDVGTFGAAIGNGFGVVAYNGIWYLVGTAKGVTFA